MERRSFGETGMQVGVLGFGAGEIGSENTPYPIVDKILGEALDAGLNVIDTAPLYSDSEEKIGRALRGRRDQFLLFTKCGRRLPRKSSWTGFWLRARRKYGRWKDKADPPEFQAPEWNPHVLEWNIEQSLRRLKTDRIDLIQIHSCSEDTLRRGEVIEVLQRARRAGKVRHIGYSGDAKAALYAVRCGHFEALQISINIADQEALDVTVPLGVPRRSPDETIRVVLDDLTEGGVHAHFGTAIDGRSLQATDLDWSYGSGPALRGAAGDLALVICGRKLPAGRLEGKPL